MQNWMWALLGVAFLYWWIKRSKKNVERARTFELIDKARWWFDERNFDFESLVYSSYTGPQAKSASDRTVVGSGSIPPRDAMVGFVLEFDVSGAVQRADMILATAASHHRAEAHAAQLTGISLYDRLMQRSERTVNA